MIHDLQKSNEVSPNPNQTNSKIRHQRIYIKRSNVHMKPNEKNGIKYIPISVNMAKL